MIMQKKTKNDHENKHKPLDHDEVEKVCRECMELSGGNQAKKQLSDGEKVSMLERMAAETVRQLRREIRSK